MDYWTVEYTQPGQSNSHTSLWHTKLAAQQAAATEIANNVNSWNMRVQNVEDLAKHINLCIACKDYASIISEYNEYQNDSTDYEYIDYFHVYMSSVGTVIPIPELIELPDAAIQDVIETISITAQVVLSKECPCGLYRADCDYHR